MGDPKPPEGVTVGIPLNLTVEEPDITKPMNILGAQGWDKEDRDKKWAELRKGLSAYFAPSELEWRIQSSGFNGDYPWAMVLAYVNNRAVEIRLDNVCGIGNWQNEFRELHSGGYECGIGITINGKDFVWKWDAADKTQVEPVKGGHSAAMKRAAQQWDIGRYLYYFPTCFAEIRTAGQNERCPDGWKVAYVKQKKNDQYGTKCFWGIPSPPEWAVPSTEAQEKDKITY